MLPEPPPSPPVQPARITVRPTALERSRQELLQLEAFSQEDHIPAVEPWIRHASSALLLGAGLAVLFVAVMPYRVVVRGNGSVRPAGELVLINAPFSGQVQAIEVRANQAVRAGQALVRLNPSQELGQQRQFSDSQQALGRQQLAQQSETEAELQAAQLEVEKAQAALQLAEAEFRRYQLLSGSGAVSRSIYDEKQARARQARATLVQAGKHLDEIRARSRNAVAALDRERAGLRAGLDQARWRLRNATVRAPVNGVVFQLKVRNPLQTVGQGQELASLAPSEAQMVVKVAVRGEEVDNLLPGQRADLRLQGCPYPDFGTLPGRVLAIAPDALPAAAVPDGGPLSRSNLYEVTLEPQGRALKAVKRLCEVRIGMAVVADITTRQESLLRFVLRKTRILLGS